MRRTLFKALLASSLLAVLPVSSALADDTIKVVYHLADGNDQAARALVNIHNHIVAEPGVKIVVVGHGDGIKFMLQDAVDKNGQAFEPKIAALASQGVEFRVCRNTLRAHDIPESKVVLEAKVVPSGVAEVARLQAKEGYVYIRP